MNITNWRTSRIRFPIRPNKDKILLSDIFKYELCIIFFTANEYMAHNLFIQRTERTPCRLPPVGILKSSYCFTLLIHSTCLEIQRTQAVDSLKSPVAKVLVCRGFFQKWRARLYQNLPLVKLHLFEVCIENSVVFDILYFI